jgi:hypothetical protein
MSIYNFPDHIKGDTFKSRLITLGFDITGGSVKMEFKATGDSLKTFEFSTLDGTIIITNYLIGEIQLQSRQINNRIGNYNYTFKLTNSNLDVKTYFKGSIKIV